MKTGVILELKSGRAVVLDGSGGFRTVAALPQWRTGDVVTIPGERRKIRWAVPAAACLTLVLAGWGAWAWMTPAALVSMDVNPAVELSLNRFDRVVEARAMNEEGAGLLDAGGVKGLAADEAVAALLSSSYLGPYLERENAVTLTVQSDDSDLEARLLALVDQTASSAAGAGVAVSCHRVDGALVEAAHGHGVTAGKYLALLELRAADPEVDISEYTHCGIGEIQAQTERCHIAHSQNTEETDAGQSCGAGGHHGYGRHERGLITERP